MKKIKKKVSQKFVSKKKSNQGVILFSVVGVLVLLVGYFFWWVPMQARIEAEKNNPAKKLAAVMVPFAREQDLTFLVENSTRDCHGSRFCFANKYQGGQSMDDIQPLITEYLTKQGYNIIDYHYTTDPACAKHILNQQKPECDSRLIKDPINQGKAIWIFSGRNKTHDTVYGTVSDKTYMDTDNRSEIALPPGAVVLDITFISHEE